MRKIRLNNGYTLFYSFELNKYHEYEHVLKLVKLNKIKGVARIQHSKKFLEYLYLGTIVGTWNTILTTGSLCFDFDLKNGSIKLKSDTVFDRYYSHSYEDTNNFKEFRKTSFKGDFKNKNKKSNNNSRTQKTYTVIYRKEIENFIYWLHGCFILNENISISLKKLMQTKLLLVEKKHNYTEYSYLEYDIKLPF
jgi:hypothetical protein